jgi:hypothetical protein
VNVDGGPVFIISGGAENKQAVRFVPSAAYEVSSVRAYLRSTGGNGQSSLFVSIVTEAGTVPGNTAVWTSTPLIVRPAGGLTTFTSTSPGTLAAGTPYWVVFDGTLTVGNAAVAHSGLPAVLGTRAERFFDSEWMRIDSTELPAVRIEGNPPLPTGACCNTVTGGCAVLDIVDCVALGLRFDGVGTACSPGACQGCRADFNGSGEITVQDLFDFLAAFFAGC